MAIGVKIDGEVSWHAERDDGIDYDTLCGIDSNDPSIGHQGNVTAKVGQKIDCLACFGIWQAAKDLKASDFSKKLVMP